VTPTSKYSKSLRLVCLAALRARRAFVRAFVLTRLAPSVQAVRAAKVVSDLTVPTARIAQRRVSSRTSPVLHGTNHALPGRHN
jgi:hypothetical protein